MNSIKINLKNTKEDLFMRSKWWGDPDLPVGFDVPDDLTFVCQIRCDEIAGFDEENVLPHKGMLYFFAAIDYYFGNFDSYCPDGFYWNSDDVKVFYIPATKLADENGIGKLANMIIVGKILKEMDEYNEESVIAALKKVVSAKHADMLDINLKAIKTGFEN